MAMQVKEAPPKKVYRVTLALTPEIRRALKRLAFETDRPMADLLRQAILEFVEKHGLLEEKKFE